MNDFLGRTALSISIACASLLIVFNWVLGVLVVGMVVFFLVALVFLVMEVQK